MDTVKIQFGHENFGNYKRLSYKWWYAIAEFVDNSTQNYFDNSEQLDVVLQESGEDFQVTITTDQDLLRIHDNAMGMDKTDLERALIVGVPPENTTGRSRYGLGLKTASCWIGNQWKIVTSKLDSDERLTVEINVDDIVKGKVDREIIVEKEDENNHYTRIEITSHNRQLAGRTIGKVKEYLKSIYRTDLIKKVMVLKYNDQILEWLDYKDEDFLTMKDGSVYKESFIFEIRTDRGNKVAEGWVGVLKTGSRSKAGFSILHRNRLIKGWPDSWRPELIYGAGGRNDLINQRLVGEINLEDFEVSHTKDEINWYMDEEELVEKGLQEVCSKHIEAARKTRAGKITEHSPEQVHIDAAVKTLEEELSSPEFIEKLAIDDALPPKEQIEIANSNIVNSISSDEPNFTAEVGDLKVKVYLDSKLSPNDPYFVNESKKHKEVIIIINICHPHWHMLEGENAILNFLRHCVYDAIAEDRASLRKRLHTDTIKLLKDNYLRVPFEILQSYEHN